MDTSIETRLREILVQATGAELRPEDLPRGDGLLEQLRIDSLTALEVIVQIEQQFGIAIEDDDFAIDMLDSLEKAVAYIEQASSEHAAVLPGALPWGGATHQ